MGAAKLMPTPTGDKNKEADRDHDVTHVLFIHILIIMECDPVILIVTRVNGCGSVP